MNITILLAIAPSLRFALYSCIYLVLVHIRQTINDRLARMTILDNDLAKSLHGAFVKTLNFEFGDELQVVDNRDNHMVEPVRK